MAAWQCGWLHGSPAMKLAGCVGLWLLRHSWLTIRPTGCAASHEAMRLGTMGLASHVGGGLATGDMAG